MLNCCGCTGSTATYTICCALLWALPLILYAVYCRMFVPWALRLILYAVYCRMFVPWALLHVCAMGTAAYIVCCVLPHVCTKGTAAYTLCCVLPHVCAMGNAAYIDMLCTATCLCHRHCTVSVNFLLWQCCLTLYVVHTLPPWFPPMGITAVHGI